jgi:hypothetical protein
MVMRLVQSDWQEVALHELRGVRSPFPVTRWKNWLHWFSRLLMLGMVGG